MTRLRDYLPLPRLVLLAALLAATLITRSSGGPMAEPAWRLIGLSVTEVGMALIAWALWTLDQGMLGGVEPLAAQLVTIGPYRWVRHPVYAGMLLALLGYALAAGSWAGLTATLGLVVPAAVYRARREEAALARKFGAAWEAYRSRTGGWLPVVCPGMPA